MLRWPELLWEAAVDLRTIACRLGLSDCVEVVEAWLGDLAGAENSDGASFKSNLEGEVCLPRTANGRAALRLLLQEVHAWQSDGRSAIAWSAHLLTRSADRLLCQGRPVPTDERTETLSRITSVETVRQYLLYDEVRDDQGVISQATGRDSDQGRWYEWTTVLEEGPSQLFELIDPRKTVRGQIPVVFASPEVDRLARWSAVPPVAELLQVLGILEPEGIPTDQCLLTFRQQDVGEGHIPSALDAFRQPYFLPARQRDKWGWTRDLAVRTARPQRGVRECVTRAFRAEHLISVRVLRA